MTKIKTMTCRQLGGTCDFEFNADSFEAMAALSKTHAMEMFQKGDQNHLEAMNQMQKMMKTPESMQQWMDAKRKEFEDL